MTDTRDTQSVVTVLASVVVPNRNTQSVVLVSQVFKAVNRFTQNAVAVLVKQEIDEEAAIEEPCEAVEIMSFKLTLLEIVQDVLNDLDSDQVNSIDDTVESQQVAAIAKSTFFELMANRFWPHLETLTKLNNVSDVTRPNYLMIPDTIERVTVLKYNKRRNTDTRDRYESVEFLHPDEFLLHVNGNNSSAPNVMEVTDDSGVQYYIRKDVAPRFYTTFDNEHIVFDSFDSAVDTTVQSSKVQAFGIRDPEWVHSDCFIPDLPGNAFPGFLAETKSSAFEKLKQTSSGKEEQKASRQKRWFSNKAGKVDRKVRTPNYGRQSSGSSSGSTRRNPLFGKE